MLLDVQQWLPTVALEHRMGKAARSRCAADQRRPPLRARSERRQVNPASMWRLLRVLLCQRNTANAIVYEKELRVEGGCRTRTVRRHMLRSWCVITVAHWRSKGGSRGLADSHINFAPHYKCGKLRVTSSVVVVERENKCWIGANRLFSGSIRNRF